MREYKTLEEALERWVNGDELTIIEDVLDGLPRTRDSAEALMGAVALWDLQSAYERLLTDYTEFLTDKEREDLETKWKKLFDIPLPEKD